MTNYQRSERGPGVIGEGAKGFEEIIHKGWTGQLSSATVDIIGDIASNNMFLPEAKCLLDRQIFSDDDWVAKKEPRWLNEEEYRVRLGKKEWFEAPVGILGWHKQLVSQLLLNTFMSSVVDPGGFQECNKTSLVLGVPFSNVPGPHPVSLSFYSISRPSCRVAHRVEGSAYTSLHTNMYVLNHSLDGPNTRMCQAQNDIKISIE